MWVFGLLLIIVMLLFTVFMIFLGKIVFQTLKKHIEKKSVSLILTLLILLLIIAFIFVDAVNVIIVYIHLLVIVALARLICFLLNKKREKKISSSASMGVGIIATAVYMIIGFICFYTVLKTDYTVLTSKNISGDFVVVQVSDSHLGYTMSAKRFNKYLEEINTLNPDIVVVTGDFIDDDTPYEDMIEGSKGLGNLNTKYGVYFVYGNHDKGYYNNREYKDADLRAALKENNVTILEDNYVELDNNIVIVGRQDSQVAYRKSIQEIVSNIDVDNKYVIVLDHEPNDYDNEEKANVDLVLSGHTHGGQLFPLGILGEGIGPNDKTYGLEKRGNTNFIVNSGISDWAILFKTGTISEYNYIKIANEND